MKRILHIIPGYGGGISSFVKNLLIDNDKEVMVIDVVGFSEYDKSFRDIVFENNGKVFTIPRINQGILKVIISFCKILKENNYYAVHCHISGYKGAFFKSLAKLFNIKIIITHAHRASDENKGVGYKYKVKLSQLLSRLFTTKFCACSEIAAKHIFGEKCLKNNNIIYIPNSINIEVFLKPLTEKQRIKYIKELEINDETIVIGHIGRFNIQKNHRFMLDIAKKLKENNLVFKLIFIGSGELEDKIKVESKENGLDNDIIFLGRREDISELLHIFNVFILPSLFEGLPTVAIESQAAGIPTILSDKISKEADMKMKLVKYLSIDKIEEWVEIISNIRSSNIPNVESRRNSLVRKGYTPKSMYNKYINNILN